MGCDVFLINSTYTGNQSKQLNTTITQNTKYYAKVCSNGDTGYIIVISINNNIIRRYARSYAYDTGSTSLIHIPVLFSGSSCIYRVVVNCDNNNNTKYIVSYGGGIS